MEILLIIVGLFLLLKSGVLSGLGFNAFPGTNPTTGITTPAASVMVAAQSLPQLDNQPLFNVAGAGISAATTAATSAANAAALAGTLSQSVATAIPIIGAVFAATISAFAAASAQRAKQATSENQAVGQEVPLWDQRTSQIVNLYNSGQVTAGQAKQLIDASFQAYWTAVTPAIQPGRNACQSGAVIPSSTQSDCNRPGYGAACCVGFDNLNNSNNYMKAAITQTENTGAPANAVIVAVFASKYGGVNRPQYVVTFTRHQ
jgi:hypothetical protein